MDVKKILLAVDDSVLGMKAAWEGFTLARQLGASVGVIYVLDIANMPVNADLGITPKEHRNNLQKEVQKTLNIFPEDAERFTPEGDPAKEILRTTETWGADIIVMGTHGKTALGQMLTGSVAEHVLRQASVPVLLITEKK
jgi:nucleotide-binding universal stress UspA family protein